MTCKLCGKKSAHAKSHCADVLAARLAGSDQVIRKLGEESLRDQEKLRKSENLVAELTVEKNRVKGERLNWRAVADLHLKEISKLRNSVSSAEKQAEKLKNKNGALDQMLAEARKNEASEYCLVSCGCGEKRKVHNVGKLAFIELIERPEAEMGQGILQIMMESAYVRKELAEAQKTIDDFAKESLQDKEKIRDAEAQLERAGYMGMDMEIAKLEHELLEARKKNTDLNRRAQKAESAARETVEENRRKGQSFGRGLANWAATDAERRLVEFEKYTFAAAAAHLRAEASKVPVGAYDNAKGCMTYNWMMWCADQLSLREGK